MEFDVVFRSYLGISRRDAVVRSMMDPQGIHAEICNSAQGASIFIVRLETSYWWNVVMLVLRYKVYKETRQYLLNDSGDKPADLFLPAGLYGMPVALDLVKACPLSGNGITDDHFVERVKRKIIKIPNISDVCRAGT